MTVAIAVAIGIAVLLLWTSGGSTVDHPAA
jgi:hypothetical protein